MTNPIATQQSQVSALNALTGTGGLLNGAKVHLLKSPVPITPTTTLADLLAAEADYGGYAAQAVGTWGAAYFGIDGKATVTAPGLQFQPSSGTTPNSIYGVFVTNTASSVLLYAEAFPAAVTLLDALHALPFTPNFPYGS